MSSGKGKWDQPHSFYDWTSPYGYSPCLGGHQWIPTGTRRTWCKECDADGDLDPLTGIVTIVFRDKKKE